ncbi:MAG TPA: SDR family NAD(P)-dependent oxidoreductase, partial [Anaerolineae bacterium]
MGSSFGLEDKVAIVTGASQGIGRALALALARNGVHIALAGLNVERAERVKSEIEALGRRALVVPTNLLHVSEIYDMASRVHSNFGKIDILVNNAD